MITEQNKVYVYPGEVYPIKYYKDTVTIERVTKKCVFVRYSFNPTKTYRLSHAEVIKRFDPVTETWLQFSKPQNPY